MSEPVIEIEKRRVGGEDLFLIFCRSCPFPEIGAASSLVRADAIAVKHAADHGVTTAGEAGDADS